MKYRAAYLTGPKQFEIKNVETPEQLRPGYFLGRITAASICGTDRGYFLNGNPVVVGHEFCVEVTDPGDTDLEMGDHVAMFPGVPCGNCIMCRQGKDNICLDLYKRDFSGIRSDGGYAEMYTGPGKYAIHVPENLSDDAAAMCEPASVAFHAVRTAKQILGEKVLVIGAGMIGLLCAEWAKAAGASYVSICEYNTKRLESAKKVTDFDGYFDSSKDDCAEQIKAAVPDGIDVIYECSSSEGGYKLAVQVIRPTGKVIWVGQKVPPTPVITQLYVMKEVQIFGSMGYTFEEYQEVMREMAKGKIDPCKFVTDICTLDDIQSAFDRLFTDTDDPALKIIVHPNG